MIIPKTTTKTTNPAVTTTPQQTTTQTTPVAIVTPRKTQTSVPIGIRTSSKVEPVIATAPSSSVSGLTPTSTGSSTSSSSSSGGSGSSSSSSPTPQTTSSYTSSNWSGYLGTSGNYTSVTASWKATSPSGNGINTSADATWIGIGGVTSADLIQIGTENTVSASGQVSTAAFYELLPNTAIYIPSMTVTPGDSMNANIFEIAFNEWTMQIADVSSGQSFTINVNYDSTNSTVEWIEEDPSYSSGRQVPFDNFTSADFTNASTVSNGSTLNLNSADAQPITLVNNANQPIATPSNIGSDGASFNVAQT